MYARITAIFLAMLCIIGCAVLSEPVAGTYDVTSTLSTDTRQNSTTGQQVIEQIWIIAKDGSGYTLTLQDAQGNEQMVANSTDGHTFTGSGDAYILTCIFHIVWEIDVSYSDNAIDGDSTSSMTAACAAGSCAEDRTFEGVKR